MTLVNNIIMVSLFRVPDGDDPVCIKIPLTTVLPRGKHIEDMSGHRLKVSANGVWPFRYNFTSD